MSKLRRSVFAVTLIAVFASVAHVAPAAGVRVPCDPLDRALCLLPFPNDRFTRFDATSPTGRRIDFLPAEMPRSIAGKPIDPTEWNRNDGFSPGSMVLTFVPGLDLHRTWGTHDITGPGVGTNVDPRDHIADIGRAYQEDAPILLIDGDTGERWPFWSELDMNAETKDDQRLLIIRPAKNFIEGHRYYVALRNMRDRDGNLIPADAHFAAYRDGKPGPLDPTFEENRRAEMNAVIWRIQIAEEIRNAAFDRSELFLAWRFTVASMDGLAGRALHIRDTAFAQLGDTDLADGVIQGEPPAVRITRVSEITNHASKQRQVDGTVTVPNFLDRYPLPPGEDSGQPVQAAPGGRFLYGLNDKPMQNPAVPSFEMNFVCTIPKTATGDDPAHPMLYGHGLLGSRNESTGSSTDRMRERNYMPCAVNWMGFANYDIANAVATLLDPSNMASMADRSQQGFLNHLFLGRALAHPGGLATDPAFQDAQGRPLFRTNELVYDGNSQGGIMGGALTALAVDFTRANLGVPGMNYSTLLNRSVDWEGPLVDPASPGLPSYASFLYTMFPNKQEQQLVMALLQMLWDRAEANGYAQHMSEDPLPNTPRHQVMLHVALGDFQVTNVSAEVEARTIGARVMDSSLAPGRHWEATPFWGLEPMPRDGDGAVLPWSGSAIVYWDSGNLVPPNANIPPLLDGGDPHEDPRRDHRSGDQRKAFFETGLITDVHAGQPYWACRPDRASQIPRVPGQFGFDWC